MSNVNVHILTGDIITINTDAIVNAANYKLLSDGGVDGAILFARLNEVVI